MIALLTFLGLAVGGGVFAGTILHTLSMSVRLNRGLDAFRSFWP